MTKTTNLSIEDIHNIRYENYERTKNLPFDELIHQTSQRAQAFKKGLVKYAQQDADVLDTYFVAEPKTPYITKSKK